MQCATLRVQRQLVGLFPSQALLGLVVLEQYHCRHLVACWLQALQVPQGQLGLEQVLLDLQVQAQLDQLVQQALLDLVVLALDFVIDHP